MGRAAVINDMRIKRIGKISTLKAVAEDYVEGIRERVLRLQIEHYRVAKTFWSGPIVPFPIPENGHLVDVDEFISYPGKAPWKEMDIGLPGKMPYSIRIRSCDFGDYSLPSISDGKGDIHGFTVTVLFLWRKHAWALEHVCDLEAGTWLRTEWFKGDIEDAG